MGKQFLILPPPYWRPLLWVFLGGMVPLGDTIWSNYKWKKTEKNENTKKNKSGTVRFRLRVVVSLYDL